MLTAQAHRVIIYQPVYQVIPVPSLNEASARAQGVPAAGEDHTHWHLHVGAQRPTSPTATPAQAPAPTPAIHTHWHYHAGASNANGPITHPAQPPAPTPQTHTWVNFILDGVRPCDAFPNAHSSNFRVRGSIPFLKTTPMREIMSELGCPSGPQYQGCGIQQIFQQRDSVWGPGQMWVRGRVDEDRSIGNTDLGRGVPGQEVWAVGYRVPRVTGDE